VSKDAINFTAGFVKAPRCTELSSEPAESPLLSLNWLIQWVHRV